MSSRKPQARSRQRRAFASELGPDGLGDLFASEERRRDDMRRRADEARYERSCASKRRYATRAEALGTARLCEDHGSPGLSAYKCPYCGGWHLTSHPWDR